MSLTRRRNTGPSLAVRELVRSRDGYACARCGMRDGEHVLPRHQIHHRRPRGMGGTSRDDTNSPANLILLCAECHALIESYRVHAFAAGWLVRQGHDPAMTTLAYKGRPVLLNHAGQIQECP